jgi:hypothetical protein
MATVAQAIHAALTARENCEKSGNAEWFDRWTRRVRKLARECLPSGSGVDHGTRVDGLTADRRGFWLLFEFHHMDECGGYDGWTNHTAAVRPTFDGLDIYVYGPNRNEVKEYLRDVLDAALSGAAPEMTAGDC